ncbi:hypothetical protein MTR67_007044 [Solanum verrucosum]|uniref:Reverse transcriptase RNase H-like domain-containing protein n=1 Tax=Solanum verrucosum TaxID=315347 RepID=A0AAF0TCQ7_SOLVR|nr:hypothetical protein MTR67_007044 [Solanum verrucosum]
MDVFTDHKSLKYVFSRKDLNFRQRRWLELLKDYDMSVLYHPGKANVVANAPNRLSMGSVAHIEDERKELAKQRVDPILVELKESLLKKSVEAFSQGGYGVLRYQGLPRIRRQRYSIWVIEDRMTKSAHFIPVKVSYSAEEYAKLYLKEIVRRCRSPISWFEVDEIALISPELVYEAIEKIRKCIGDPSTIVPLEGLEIKENLAYEEVLIEFLDRQVKRLTTKEVASVKVL